MSTRENVVFLLGEENYCDLERIATEQGVSIRDVMSFVLGVYHDRFNYDHSLIADAVRDGTFDPNNAVHISSPVVCREGVTGCKKV